MYNPSDISTVPTLLKRLYEVVAAHRNGLALLPPPVERHGDKDKNGAVFQIKATQGRSVDLSSDPDHLLVSHFAASGECIKVFNGPGGIALATCGQGHHPVRSR
jgi:hypothetical protein